MSLPFQSQPKATEVFGKVKNFKHLALMVAKLQQFKCASGRIDPPQAEEVYFILLVSLLQAEKIYPTLTTLFLFHAIRSDLIQNDFISIW